MNIFSGSTDGNGLGAALTNPTQLSRRKGRIKQDYPVHFNGVVWPDAEHAYLTLATGDAEHDDKLMVGIIAAKFAQHPALRDAVKDLGGVRFLETCKHITNARSARFRAWEGFGRQSRFIRNLIEGYRLAVT
jgi:hypothetical protein